MGDQTKETSLNPSKQLVGQFHLLKVLGQSEYATTYLAKRKGAANFSGFVAVKRTSAEITRHTNFASHFEYHTQRSRLLSHPHILRVFDMAKIEDSFVVGTDFVHGQSLTQVIQRMRDLGYALPPEFVAFVGTKIAQALHYALTTQNLESGEAMGALHLGVKPNNILIGYDGQVKLADFGHALAFQQKYLEDTGYFGGEVGYFSPELIRGETVDGRSDIFSLCNVLYEMLTTHRLFDAPDSHTALAWIHAGNYPEQLLAHLDSPLTPYLQTGLKERAEDRFADFEEFDQQLKHYLTETHGQYGEAEVSAFVQQWFGEEYESSQAELKQLDTIPLDMDPDEDDEVTATEEIPIQRGVKRTQSQLAHANSADDDEEEDDGSRRTDWGSMLGSLLKLAVLMAILWVGFQFIQPKIQDQNTKELSAQNKMVGEPRSPNTQNSPHQSANSRKNEGAPTKSKLGAVAVKNKLASPKPLNACQEEVARFCREHKTHFAQARCLFRRKTLLSTNCLAQVDGWPVFQYCFTEIEQYCQARLTQDSAVLCLREKVASLSAGCQSRLDEWTPTKPKTGAENRAAATPPAPRPQVPTPGNKF